MIIETAKDFYNVVVRGNFEDHCSGKADLRTAINLSISFLSLRDWTFETRCSSREFDFGAKSPLSSLDKFDEHICRACPELKVIHRIANSFKHYRLRKFESELPNCADDISLEMLPYGEASYGTGRFGGLTFKVKTKEALFDFDKIANSSLSFWERAYE